MNTIKLNKKMANKIKSRTKNPGFFICFSQSFLLYLPQNEQKMEIKFNHCETHDNTQQHVANVKNITTIGELKQYDYTSGYPEKLRF